jgi:hypothetical protein
MNPTDWDRVFLKTLIVAWATKLLPVFYGARTVFKVLKQVIHMGHESLQFVLENETTKYVTKEVY